MLETGGVIADRMLTIQNLMEMSESAGLRQLDNLVPRACREGWDDGLIQRLINLANDPSNDDEQRQKARTFFGYANELRRSLY